MPTALLEVSDVTVRFGGITALDRVSFSVQPGTIAGLIGPNGAGKTTLFNCLSRLYAFSEGRILFEGRPITEHPPHRIAALGIGRTFQNLALFRTMSVQDNVMLGGHCRSSSGFLANALRLPRVREEERQLQHRAAEVIALLDLAAVAQRPVSDLPFGTAKRVELARALMSRPKLLLLDEPSVGLAPMLIQQIFSIITEINQQGTTILLVEQNAQQALSRAHRAYVLETGRIVKSGTGSEL